MPAQRRRKTLAQKVGVSQEKLSRKIAKVRHEDPSLTPRQAAGKAAGILSHDRKKRRTHDGAEAY
jgi:hypothetical protein